MDEDLGRLAVLLSPSAGEPASPPVERHLAAGRTALRRRRVAGATATLLTLGVVGVGAAALGSAGPAARTVEPAGPTPDRTSQPDRQETPPAPEATEAAETPAPGAGMRRPSPDVIGAVRAPTPAELREDGSILQDFHVSLGDDGSVVLARGWRVVDRYDDLGPVEVLNRRMEPDEIVDSVAVAVARDGAPESVEYVLLDAREGGLSGVAGQNLTPLTGTLAWWATQQVYGGTPMGNGTPGVDVRLADDGRLEPVGSTEILEQQRGADVGGLVPADQTLVVAACVRLADGRVVQVVASQGPRWSGTQWFQPDPAPADLDAFLGEVRAFYGEDPR